jgi:hypothetical protein
VLFAVKAFLEEHYSDDSIRGVYFEEALAIEVVVYKEGGLSEYIIECLEHLDILVIKGELVVCLYKLSEWCSNLAIIPYKLLVEVIEAEEGLDPFYYIRVVLVFNHLNLI